MNKPLTIGLEITIRIFEVMGTRSMTVAYGFDCYWRDLRVFTLHGPLEYKICAVEQWYLTDQYPTLNLYL